MSSTGHVRRSDPNLVARIRTLEQWELWRLGLALAWDALNASASGDFETAAGLRVDLLEASHELERRARRVAPCE